MIPSGSLSLSYRRLDELSSHGRFWTTLFFARIVLGALYVLDLLRCRRGLAHRRGIPTLLPFLTRKGGYRFRLRFSFVLRTTLRCFSGVVKFQKVRDFAFHAFYVVCVAWWRTGHCPVGTPAIFAPRGTPCPVIVCDRLRCAPLHSTRFSLTLWNFQTTGDSGIFGSVLR